MENKRLLRSNNRMLAGVCAGIAEYFGWEVSTVRIVYALATIFTAFSGGIIYLILWIVMPERRYRDGYEDRVKEKLHNRKLPTVSGNTQQLYFKY